MNEHRLLFHDAELQHFDWCSLDFEDPANNRVGSAEIEQLDDIFPPGTTLTVFIPQELVLMSSVQMPPRASKQQLNAIGFAVEEQLAEDIEDCFFATLPQQADHTVPVAVISLEMMDRIVAVLAAAQLNVRYILPAIYLCPWEEDSLGITPLNEGFLVRGGQHQGMYCQAALLPVVVDMMQRAETEPRTRLLTVGELSAEVDSAEWQVEVQASEPLLSRSIDLAMCLNLKQKQYQGSQQLMSLLLPWKWPAAALGVLVLVLLANALLDGVKLRGELDLLLTQQQMLLSEHLPQLEPGPQPRRQLAKLLADQQSGGQGKGFIDQLHEYVRLKTGFDAIKTGKIQFQKGSLVINIESPDLNSLEGFRNKIGRSSVPAKIENVNISPEKTTARLVMGGAS